jgi:hypothetical protein
VWNFSFLNSIWALMKVFNARDLWLHGATASKSSTILNGITVRVRVNELIPREYQL